MASAADPVEAPAAETGAGGARTEQQLVQQRRLNVE